MSVLLDLEVPLETPPKESNNNDQGLQAEASPEIVGHLLRISPVEFIVTAPPSELDEIGLSTCWSFMNKHSHLIPSVLKASNVPPSDPTHLHRSCMARDLTVFMYRVGVGAPTSWHYGQWARSSVLDSFQSPIFLSYLRQFLEYQNIRFGLAECELDDCTVGTYRDYLLAVLLVWEARDLECVHQHLLKANGEPETALKHTIGALSRAEYFLGSRMRSPYPYSMRQFFVYYRKMQGMILCSPPDPAMTPEIQEIRQKSKYIARVGVETLCERMGELKDEPDSPIGKIGYYWEKPSILDRAYGIYRNGDITAPSRRRALWTRIQWEPRSFSVTF
ncbi:uncharacterized protein BDR25DRAFT_310597 [Lindgomyces ingoldianus]|uniref:Uncharacterized protein n=1 Tax=Lindgomyces ingoldianus TaxID=673940 RepID=A0ACB6R7C4_9PLEO|nr:uncharacterized protein BDR25DRAFT_310597 [Lindgomyces ingoldianus]KAF2475154.1 hypothetical protein BDR25DRAFT_310597 [Lindgomyces ingoldianus]